MQANSTNVSYGALNALAGLKHRTVKLEVLEDMRLLQEEVHELHISYHIAEEELELEGKRAVLLDVPDDLFLTRELKLKCLLLQLKRPRYHFCGS